MPVDITCAQCGVARRVPDSLAGKKGRCRCGAIMQIPAARREVAASKVCTVCGIDVSRMKRTKDPRGRYYCTPCFDAASAARAAPVESEPLDITVGFRDDPDEPDDPYAPGAGAGPDEDDGLEVVEEAEMPKARAPAFRHPPPLPAPAYPYPPPAPAHAHPYPPPAPAPAPAYPYPAPAHAYPYQSPPAMAFSGPQLVKCQSCSGIMTEDQVQPDAMGGAICRDCMMERAQPPAPPRRYIPPPRRTSAPSSGGGGFSSGAVGHIFFGLFLCAVSIIVTVVSYNAASEGGTYYVWTGGIIWGLCHVFRGLFGGDD